MPRARPTPPNKPAIEPRSPMIADSMSRVRVTWRPTGADGAQQRVLALALRGRDREDVVDHEHADAERNEREDRQEQGDEPETALDVGLGLLGDLGRGQRSAMFGSSALWIR